MVCLKRTRRVIDDTSKRRVILGKRSLQRHLALIRRDKEAAVKAMGRFLNSTDREVLESVYDEYRDVFPVTPLMTAAEVQAVLDVAKSAKAKTIKPQEFFDNTIVQKIQASGFIEQVNQR